VLRSTHKPQNRCLYTRIRACIIISYYTHAHVCNNNCNLDDRRDCHSANHLLLCSLLALECNYKSSEQEMSACILVYIPHHVGRLLTSRTDKCAVFAGGWKLEPPLWIRNWPESVNYPSLAHSPGEIRPLGNATLHELEWENPLVVLAGNYSIHACNMWGRGLWRFKDRKIRFQVWLLSCFPL
jgi:hypothetical protein